MPGPGSAAQAGPLGSPGPGSLSHTQGRRPRGGPGRLWDSPWSPSRAARAEGRGEPWPAPGPEPREVQTLGEAAPAPGQERQGRAEGLPRLPTPASPREHRLHPTFPWGHGAPLLQVHLIPDTLRRDATVTREGPHWGSWGPRASPSDTAVGRTGWLSDPEWI